MSCAKIQKGSVLPTFWLQSGHRNEEKSLCLDKASAQPTKKILEKNPIKTVIYRMDPVSYIYGKNTGILYPIHENVN